MAAINKAVVEGAYECEPGLCTVQWWWAMSLDVLGHVTMSYEPLKGACCGVVMEVHLRYKPLAVPHIFRY